MTSKLCFLTVGATASFSALIEAAVSPAFLTALESQGYTELSVQYGQDGKQLFEKCKSNAQATSKLTVTGFDLDKVGLARHMRRAKGGKDAAEGVVISHADNTGSGSILDALRIAVPVIVVPNETLLDNHQVELAEALAEQEYVVHGRLVQLPQALADAEKLRQRAKEWPPVNSGPERGLKGILDDEMGFLD
ncbi:hypothetical protein Q7P37_002198 [Cladosporium fusiforme]